MKMLSPEVFIEFLSEYDIDVGYCDPTRLTKFWFSFSLLLAFTGFKIVFFAETAAVV